MRVIKRGGVYNPTGRLIIGECLRKLVVIGYNSKSVEDLLAIDVVTKSQTLAGNLVIYLYTQWYQHIFLPNIL